MSALIRGVGQTVAMTYRKGLAGTPPGYTSWEAAGLTWLAEAQSSGTGARVVPVIDVTDEALILEHLDQTLPTEALAEDFGRRLAATHDAGASAFGCPPPSWERDHGWLGPAEGPLPLPTQPVGTWGAFYAEQRIRHTLRLGMARGMWQEKRRRTPYEKVAIRLENGEFDDADTPARIHGDLWSGNILWTTEGGTLIDPAAHGGHRETDLASLALFGTPHVETIFAAYDEAHPLTPGWRERQGLHHLHLVMLHAVLFGGGYVHQAASIARRYA